MNRHYRRRSRRPVRTGIAPRVVALAGAALLEACGGGGGGGTGLAATAPLPISAPPAAEDGEFQRNAASYQLIGADAAHDAKRTGAGVLVGIVDDGLAPANPEFDGRISKLSKDFGYDSRQNPTTHALERLTRSGLMGTDSQHGTKVASILAAAHDDKGIVGIAPDATIVVLRADVANLDTHTISYTGETVAAAIRYAGDVGVGILNISLATGGRSDDVVVATEAFARTGGLMVWSAGNVGASEPDTSANVTSINRPSWISVGGLVPSSGQIHYLSNRGGAMADRFLVASMIVNAQSADGTIGQVTGTSFAAPQVAGAAALLLGRWPQLTGKQAGDILLASAKDIGAPGTDPVYGRGLLDIEAALKPSKPYFGDGQTQAAIDKSGLVLPEGFGATELKAALSAVTILDAFGRDYAASLAGLVTPAANALHGDRFALSGPSRTSAVAAGDLAAIVQMRNVLPRAADQGGRWALSSAAIGGDGGAIAWHARFGLAAGPSGSAAAAYSPLADKHLQLALPIGRPTLLVASSAGGHGRSASVGLSGASTAVRIGAASETGTLFGAPGRGALRLARRTRTGFVQADYGASLSGAWTWRLTGSLGLSRLKVPVGSIFRSIGPLLTTQAAIDFEGPIGRRSDLRLSLVQPTTVEHGSGYAILPTGYDLANRRLRTEGRNIDLAADQRPFMLAAMLSSRLFDGPPLALGLRHSMGGETSVSLNASVAFR